MPIYEYRCGTCGDRVEVLVRSLAATPRCPDCGRVYWEGTHVRRIRRVIDALETETVAAT